MKYFTLPELCFSQTALKHNISNEPTAPTMRNMMALVDKVLDPVRQRWGKPLIVTSGYRCAELNKLVGGTANSQHLHGLAADIVVVGCNPIENWKLFDMIRNSDIPFDQVIAEGYDQKRGYSSCHWVHVSYQPKGGRKQIIVSA